MQYQLNYLKRSIIEFYFKDINIWKQIFATSLFNFPIRQKSYILILRHSGKVQHDFFSKINKANKH